MVLNRNKKINVYPCKPQFYYIKVGFGGSKLYRLVFVMISDNSVDINFVAPVTINDASVISFQVLVAFHDRLYKGELNSLQRISIEWMSCFILQMFQMAMP